MNISVIVPVYNVEKYLKACLESIVNQTCRDFDLILVDDESTDNSGNICDEYAKKYANIRVFHKKNSGLVDSWQYGLARTSKDTQYVVFIDADDWISNKYMERITQVLEKKQPDLILNKILMSYENGGKEREDKSLLVSKLYEKKELKSIVYPRLLNNGGFMDRGVPVSRWAKVIKKELLVKNLKYSDKKVTYGEDLNIIFPVLLDANSIYVDEENNEAVYYYRIRKDSMQHGYDKNKLNSIDRVYNHLIQICHDKGYTELLKQVEVDYICACVQCYKNELEKLNYNSAKDNIDSILNNNKFGNNYKKVDSKFGMLNGLILFLIYNNKRTYITKPLYYLLAYLKKRG